MKALTPRQRQILRHLAAGDAYADIAGQLGISVETVRTHCRAIYACLNVRNRHEATMLAIQEGWLAINTPAAAKPLNLRLHDSGAIAVRNRPGARDRVGAWQVILPGGGHYVTQRLTDQHVATWQVLYSHNIQAAA